MSFQRESEGVYRYHRKRVFMKIEGDTIVIRVGGGYLTMDEFVQVYCVGAEEQTKAKIAAIIQD
jgi:predicted Rossmann-fold nucleotide-binding protein